MPAISRNESFPDRNGSERQSRAAEKAPGFVRDHLPLILFGGVAGSVLLVHWLFPAVLSRLSICGMQRVFGVPCPMCGGTRSFYALSNLDVAKALALNPLACLGAAAVSIWFAVWVSDRIFKTRFAAAFQRRLLTRAAGKVLIGLCLLNWVYLFFQLPK